MLNGVAIAAFIVLTVLAGGRLLLLWRETRKLPELLIAILILGVGTVAVGGGYLIRALVPDGPLYEALRFVPMIGADVGMAALYLFTWKVYRPGSQAARGVAVGAIGVLAGLVFYAALRGSAGVLEESGLSLLASAIYLSAMAWSAAEALDYWSAMRRRLRLGLADPLVTNRLLLWGVATGTAGLGIAIGTLARHLGGIVDFASTWVTLCYAGHGMVSAVAFWLAFKPPSLYARWVTASAPAGPGALRGA